MFDIKKNVPIPKDRNMWPFKNMEVGDSIEVPKDWWIKAVTNAHAIGGQKNMKFKTQWNKAENKGIIWRIK